MCLYSRVRWVVEFLTQDYKITIMLSKKLMEFKEIIVFYEIVFGLLKIGQNSRKGIVHKFDKILAFLTTCVDIFFGMYKHRHFWTTYLPRLVNIIKKCLLTLIKLLALAGKKKSIYENSQHKRLLITYRTCKLLKSYIVSYEFYIRLWSWLQKAKGYEF